MSAFLMVARSELQQTTQFNQSKNATCEFEILNPEWVKQRFDQFISVEKAELVLFHIEVNKEFLNDTNFDNIHENGLLRWIWISDSKTAILSYPVDLDGLTLQLTKSVERTIHVYINASSTYIPNYTQCFLSLYQTLSDQILYKNKTDGKFCHRHFKGQNWKHVMNFFLGSWLGYDFECFNTFCSDVRCADIVKKGTVNIAITLFIFLLCINFPLFHLFLPKRQHISAGHSMHYHKGDSPYSFARFFLHLNRNFQELDRHDGDNVDEGKSFSEWIDFLLTNSHIVKPEAKVLTAFYFVLLGEFLLQELYIRKAIADFDKYSDIYHPYYLPFDETLLDLKFKFKVLSILPFTCSFFYLLPVLLVYMSYYGQSKNTFVSLNPFGIKQFDEIVEQQGSSIKYTGYTQFAMKFLTRISFFFEKELPYFLFVTLFVFKLIVYTIFVAGPLFSTSQTSYQFWAISLAVLVYILKYTMTFNSNYKQLLNNLLELQKKLEEEDNLKSELIKATNNSIQNVTDDYSIENKKKEYKWIPIELFDEIASDFMPLKMQLLILFLKLFFTGVFLYVTFDSISKGGNAGFLTTQIPLIITVVMPALADRLWSPSNIDDIKANEDDIKDKISKYKLNNQKGNSDDCHDDKNCFLKHFALICPIFYTVICILKSILFCRKKVQRKAISI
ncbi:unnamed protein product [Mytilus coruscus]|uniref:Uncharacterized protein n=1 Tax=Mytilus coruscus TaxID=42192 RepID=A0A6J8D673_MYTCO|nr:unnamed protein product [Mytilus coruscus]